jgi:DNA-directed RNA polymerase specialized sigma24 family protein
MRLCLRWTRGNFADAEDLLSEASLRILESEVGVARPVVLWRTVINNLGRDRSRRLKRWQFASADSARPVLDELPGLIVDGERQLLLNERLAATARKLRALSDRQRSAVLLRTSGTDYLRIAELLSTSSGNARKLVEGARRALLAVQPSRRGSRARRHSQNQEPSDAEP